ncbi:GMC family oxidoreductase [Nannocystis pusilla]|uniref:GMC family oxidoreductase n=1 Tax=Nannocystis pusilla TaxID=889268 RepID=UPI003DA4DC2B
MAHGLGNAHDHVGRWFMEHPHVQIGIAALPSRGRWHAYQEHIDPALGHATMSALGLTAAAQRAHRLLNATVQLWPDDAPEGSSDPDVARVRLLLRAEQSPNPDSRVTLADELDAFGVPVARLDWQLTPLDWDSICTTAEIVAAALERHGEGRVELAVTRDAPWPSQPTNKDHYRPWGCHHLGTTRMSTDPRFGVVDRDAKVHGIENLFIAGSSVFPTGGYANPTLAVIALALRTVEHLRGAL